MDQKEIDEFRGLAQLLNEIERRYPDPESITLRQIAELSQAHHLTVPDILAIVTLIRWGRMYTRLKQLGERQDDITICYPDLPSAIPDDSMRESAGDRPAPTDGRRGRHSIEFL